MVYAVAVHKFHRHNLCLTANETRLQILDRITCMYVCNGHHHGLPCVGSIEVSTPGAGCTAAKGSEIETNCKPNTVLN